MSHERVHAPFELIRAADIDRHFALIENGVLTDPSAVQAVLQGQITLSELHPSLQALVLQSVFSSIRSNENFTGDGIAVSFALAAAPLAGDEEVFLNGLHQHNGVDYTLVGNLLTFLGGPPGIGDLIDVRYSSTQSVSLILLGSFAMPYDQIFQMNATLDPIVQQFFVYGHNKIGGMFEVAKFEAITLNQLGSSVNVDSGNPDRTAMILTTDTGEVRIWAIGAAAGTHTVTRITASTMAATVLSMNDPATTVTAIATDGPKVYVFMKGGATLQANSVQRFDAATSFPETVIGPGVPSVATTGSVDMAISLSGDLYVSYGNFNASGSGEIRKFDVNTGFLLKRLRAADFGAVNIRPIQILKVLDKVLVLDDLNNKLYQIDATDAVTTVTTFGFTPTGMRFDLSDLWVSEGFNLHKLDMAGTILNTVVPQAAKTIQNIMSGLGLIWVSYSDDTVVSDKNLTKIFPGLPSTP